MIHWQRGKMPTLENIGEIRAIHIDGIKRNVWAVTRIIKGDTVSHTLTEPGLVMCECDDLIHDDYIFSEPIDIEKIVTTSRNLALDKTVKIKRGKLFIVRFKDDSLYEEFGYVLTCGGISFFTGLTEKDGAVVFMGHNRRSLSEVYEVQIVEEDEK